MKTLLQAALLAAVLPATLPAAGPAAAAAQPAATATPAATPRLVDRQITLAEIGFPDGLSFTGFSGRRDLFFPLPAGVGIRGLRLEGGLETQIPAPIRAAARIGIDDVPRWTGVLGAGAVPLAFDLSRRADGGDFIKLSLDYGATWTDDRCADQRLPGGFVTLRPDTQLRYSYDPAAVGSLRTAMAVLPRRLRIGLAATPLSRSQYEAALALAAGLTRQGHQVAFTRITSLAPDMAAAPAEIIVAPASALATFAVAQASGSARLLRIGTDPVIALTDSADIMTARYLTGPWSALAGGPAATARASLPPGPTTPDEIPFSRLGLGTGVQEVVDRGEWALRFDYAQLPRGKRPTALRLDLAPGAALTDQPQLAHVFVNDLLLRSVTLDSSAARQLTVPLPDGLLGRSNSIRVVLQRQPTAGNCKDAPLASPAQLLPGSSVVLADDGAAPADFFALGSAFADGVTVVVPPAALADPVASLTLAQRILPGLLADGDRLRVAVDEGKAPDGPFLLLPGTRLPAGLTLPVALDVGAVKVVDRQGRLLLDVSGTPGLLVAQLAQAGGHSGLVLQTAGDQSDPVLPSTPLALDRGTVAFADAGGLLMAVDTARERAVRVEVGDSSPWADWLDRFRVLVIAVVWLALTALAAGAFARWYRARGQS